MQTFKQEVSISNEHKIRIDLDVPVQMPVGRAEAVLIIQPLSESEVSGGLTVRKEFTAVELNTNGYRFNRGEANER